MNVGWKLDFMIEEEFNLVVLYFIKLEIYDFIKVLNLGICFCSSDIRIKVIGGFVKFIWWRIIKLIWLTIPLEMELVWHLKVEKLM